MFGGFIAKSYKNIMSLVIFVVFARTEWIRQNMRK